MEPALITAIVAGLATCGGGAWKLIDRADKKRERREIAVEELLKARVASLEAQLQKQASDFEKERRRNKRYTSRVKATAGKWRDQLLVHDLQPDPAEWPTEDEHDDTE
ncbi:hypothetical protein [Arthrobacter sp. fls2-241-R2A-172]|uniref:hypothetical protein n=1 Tax=Arthrobacter sp. fls2-241-R2A-172 TaxID=3040325 RepID=UPI00254CA82B|nr:hypothetical protein [Arthrobacter sp. fls2-241-R2A-172]